MKVNNKLTYVSVLVTFQLKKLKSRFTTGNNYSIGLSHYHTGVWPMMPYFRVMKNESAPQLSIESNTKVPLLMTPFLFHDVIFA